MRVALVIFLLGMTALAAGCGGGGKKSSSPPAQTSSGSTVTTKSSGSGGAEPSSGPNENLPGFASAKNCQDLAGLAAKVASAVTANSGNPATMLKSEAAELQALAQAAPSDIRADFQTFAAAFSGFLHALEKAGYQPGSAAAPTPSAGQARAIAKAARAFDTPKLRRAEQHLSAWARRNCKGVQLGG